MCRRLGLISLIVLAACGSDDNAETPLDPGDPSAQDAGTEAATDAQTDDAVSSCGTALDRLPDHLTELRWDDDQAKSNVREQDWTITVNNHPYVLNKKTLYEAVRFELERPATIHGFAVRWQHLPDDDQAELTAGLYADFGYNGFDFWAKKPLWQGTRCRGDISDETWTVYGLDSPVRVEHPGLVYVAHKAKPGEAVFAFDGSTIHAEGKCESWGDCHSAINLPDAETMTFFNGVSFPFQYDFMVRLYVQYDDPPTDKTVFAAEPATPKGHVSFGDYDNDGFDDAITDGPTLLHNDGTGRFEDVTAQAGLAALGRKATGGVWGDYDNDGCLDLLLYAESYTEPDTLLRSNCDGTFTDVTEQAGLIDEQTVNNCGNAANTRSPTAAAAFWDIDADGWLDIYQANFICWEKETFYPDTVYRNRGDGTFESWSGTHGFTSAATPSRAAVPADYDGDGDVDLFVANYRLKANLFFDNQGEGTVIERAEELGLAGHPYTSYYGHTIGAAWGDLNGDGRLDLIAANLAHPRFFHFSDKTQVLIQQPNGTFQDLAGDWKEPRSDAGLRYQETHSVPALADFNHDGALDLVITAVYDGRPTDFYWGNGDGTFRLDAYRAGLTTTNGWGVSVSDFDNDGDPDLFAHQPFRNQLEQKGHWVQVRVVGNAGANRAAIGSTVRVSSGGVVRMRHVQGGSGKGGQDSMYLHVGLGPSETVDSIEVQFPGGKLVRYDGPFDADQRIWVYEDGQSKTGWVAPF